MYLIDQIVFKIRNIYFARIRNYIRVLYFGFLGFEVGKNSSLSYNMYISWPHKIKIGRNCQLEHDIIFKFVGIWSKNKAIIIGNDVFIGNHCEFNISKYISIGDMTLISSGCKFIDHNHDIALSNDGYQPVEAKQEIFIGNNVWLGCNVIVLKGVKIQDGAVVGAGAVVTKSIGKNEIWAGIPAKKIGQRK